jgi:hypothetical protein
MRRPEFVPVLVVALPPLMLAVAGLVHPMDLTPQTAHTWRELHLALLPIFPLLGLAPWLLLRDEHFTVRWLVAVLGFAYAIYYTGLDVLAGIAAGALQLAGLRPAASVMFTNGNQLATYGVWAYLLACLVAAVMALIRAGGRAVPGSVLVVAGAASFLTSHIYWPRGVLTMLALGLGWAALVTVRPAAAVSSGQT